MPQSATNWDIRFAVAPGTRQFTDINRSALHVSIMKLAVLGTDPDTLQLAAAAVAEGHSIAWIGDIRPGDAEALRELAPGVIDQSSAWELVLDRRTADAVIVGRGGTTGELRAEQLKRIAAEATPLLATHPACESVLPYYEVDMTRREMGGIVRHYNSVAGRPILAELGTWVRDGHPTIGAVHQVTCERRVGDTSRENVLELLARDAEAIATVAGDIKRVSAIGPKINQPSFAALQVQMTCAGPASVRWSIGSPAGGDGDIVLTLVGERGTMRVLGFDAAAASEPRAWQLEMATADGREQQSLASYDAPRNSIRQFADAVALNVSHQPELSTWNTATRSMEVVDAVELSLEKGRTLDVHQQELTERLAFRGTMAAMGCGLLLVGFFVFVVVSLFGAAEGEQRTKLISSWPAILLAVLAFFLLLQCAPLLVRPRKLANEKRSDDR
jgi:hypothetical protein